MEVDSRRAVISIVMDHPDPGMRQSFFNRFLQLKDILYNELGEMDWEWQAEATDEHGRNISTIYKQEEGVNIFRTEDWPAIISFLKPRIIALDGCWSMVKYQFSNL